MKEIKQTSEEQREIRKRVLSLLARKEAFKKQEREYKEEAQEVNRIIRTFLGKYGMDKGLIETRNEKVALTIVEPTSVVWDADKLSKRLSKEQSAKAIKKEIIINDYGAVVELLKQYGVPAKQFKSLLGIKREVDEDALNNLFELGHLTKADIKGCYEVKKGTAYVKLTKSEKKE